MSEIFELKNYIDGKWVEGESSTLLRVYNPSNRELLATTHCVSILQIEQAIESSRVAQLSWGSSDVRLRQKLLHQWANLIIDNITMLQKMLTLEQGKTLEQSRLEIESGVKYLRWYADQALRIKGEILTSSHNRKILVEKKPVGVVAAITPWNFPVGMILRKCAPAIAAGCCICLKPSEETPLTAVILVKLAEEAGLPVGVLNLLIGEPKTIGNQLLESNVIRKLSFTGSTRVGKLLMRDSANTVKKLSLELGGNAPFIVFEDADLELAIDQLLLAKMRNSGQACIAPNRIYIARSIMDSFIKLLYLKLENIRAMDGLITGAQLGPLINEMAVSKIQRLITEALNSGSKLILGSSNLDNGLFVDPIILLSKDHSISIFTDEIFGPIYSLYAFDDVDEVVDFANSTEYGLAAYAFTNNHKLLWRLSNELNYGMLGLNNATISGEHVPFGGIKQSGFGREGADLGLNEYLVLKYVNWCYE